ncbi:nSTAND1 domain-containing NTPase [Streptomyces sp. NPDC055722]
MDLVDGAPGDGSAPRMPSAVAQVLGPEGDVAGAAFLVGEGVVATCAHVVAAAGHGPGDTLRLAFPHAQGAPRVRGVVVSEAWRDPHHSDVAVVQLEEAPDGVVALALGSAEGCRGHRVRSFGFPAQAPTGGHFGYGIAGDLLPAGAEESGSVLQLTGANDLTTGFSGAPVVDDITGLVIGMLTAITTPDEHSKGQGIAYATPVEVLRQVWPDLAEQQVCPYRGLEPFTAEHAGWFHGRDSAMEGILAALGSRQRVVLVLGPSGTGKSSLVQAGVLPALAEGRLPGSDRWLPLVVRPGGDLLTELEQAGLSGAATDGIVPAAERRLAAEPTYQRLVVVVDQFEELFTGAADSRKPVEGLVPADELVRLIRSQAAASVVLIMRDDFYPRLAAAAPALLEAAASGLFNVPASVSIPDLRAIITRPAQAVGLRVENGLPERIITDLLAADANGSTTRQAAAILLPPLELALRQMWERRQDGCLTHRAYQQIGEVTGGLTSWCNTVVSRLPDGQRLTAQRILTALVRPADDARSIPATRQQVLLGSLKALATDAPLTGDARDHSFEEVLNTLTRHRIVTTHVPRKPDGTLGPPVAELIHDALIRDWKDLRDWLADDRAFQAWLHRAGEQQARFAKSGHKGDLLDGTDFSEGTAWARQRGLPADVAAFLSASQRHQQAAARRARRINGILASLLAMALIATGVALWQQQTAVAARERAVAAQRIAQSRQLAAQSAALFDSAPDLASLLAVQAYRSSPTAEARASLIVAATRPLRYTVDVGFQEVKSVAISPDGHLLATGGEHRVRLWDADSGKLRRTITNLSEGVNSVAFSPDGRTLATGGDGTIRLWDLATGRPRRPLTGLSAPVWSVAFSHDGRTLVAGSGADRKVRLWDVATGTVRKDLIDPERSVDSVAISPDGHTVAAGSGNGPRVRVWDVATGKVRHTLTVGTASGGVFSVAFSPDGRTLAAPNDRTVRVWSVATGKVRHTLTVGTASGGVFSAAFSPDGRTLATGSDDGTARLWDANSGRILKTLTGHGTVLSVAFSPDGRTLATGSDDGTARLWDVPGNTILDSTSWLDSVAFSWDGRTVITGSGSDGAVRLWNAVTGKPGKTLTDPTGTGEVNAVGLSPDDHTLAVSTLERVRLLDLATGKTLRTLRTGVGTPVAFSPDGHTLATTASGVTDGTGAMARLWNVDTGASKILRDPTDGSIVTSMAFSPDGHTLATSGDGDRTVQLWDGATGRVRKHLIGHTEPVNSVAFSPDGRTLATGSDDGTARLWDADTGGTTKTLTEPTGAGRVDSVAFSHDGRTLATSGDDDQTVRLWDVATGRIRDDLTDPTSSVHSAVFSPMDQVLATSSNNGTTRLWRLSLPDAVEAINKICGALHRDFTGAERSQYLSDQAPGPVCPT